MKNPNLIRVAQGTVAHGQFFQKPNIAREGGKPKNVGRVATAFGMRSQSRPGGVHAYLHGQAVDDETADKLSHNGKSVAVHDGMGTSAKHAHQRGIIAHVEDASKHLRAAGRLSARDKAKSEAEGFDHSFLSHKISKQAALPASKRRADR